VRQNGRQYVPLDGKGKSIKIKMKKRENCGIMREMDYSDLSREDLIKTIQKLESRKKYGLIWDEEKVKEQFEKDAENALPVLKEISSKEIVDKDPSKPVNILIEGDNYHALSVLNFTHQGKIDVIYIDPPYNTGAADWKYNNDFVDVNDIFRHSKWLSFMSKRLELAKNLLKSTGIIVVTIDDYEIATLRLLMNDILGLENYLGTIAIRNNPSGRSTVSGFSVNHEYALFYSRTSAAVIGRLPHNDEQVSRYKGKDEIGSFEWENFRKNGTDSDRADRPKQFYPLVINNITLKLRVPKISWNTLKRQYDFKDKLAKNEEIILPMNDGNEKVWKFGLERMSSVVGELLVKRKNGSFELYRKKYLSEGGSLPRTWWDKPGYSARDNGTRTLTEILGVNNKFDFPKAPEAVEDCIRVANVPSDGIVLDFFAGSGTTAQAVLELNKKDNGTRQFILCTNNENNICEDVTYPRIKNVIKGYKVKDNGQVIGFGGTLKYFKTKFVKKNSNSDDFKTRITNECTEMLCLREGVFDEIKKAAHYRIFQQRDKTLAVYYSLTRTSLPALKKELEKIDGEKILYCFTLDPVGLSKTEFRGWRGVTLEPIPQKILDVYKQIYEY
jgi:adenine-specific DNA-methyltransferase